MLSHTEGFSDPYIPTARLPNFPKSLTELFDPSAIALAYPELLQKCDEAGADPGGRALEAEAPPLIFRLYLINTLSIIMKFCLSMII